MALEGSIKEFGLADILQLLYTQNKTGILEIKSSADNVNIYFNEGNIVDITSKKMSSMKRLTEILLKKGFISKGDIQSIHERQKKDGIRVFLKSGIVAEKDFISSMEDLVTDTLVYMFTWKEGTYEFIQKKLPPLLASQPSMDTQHLLMEGMRIVDEYLLIEGKLDLEVVYNRKNNIDKNSIGINELKVYSLIDGKKDVSALINASGLEYLETAKVILLLDEKGFIKPSIEKPIEVNEEKSFKKTSKSPLTISTISILVIISLIALKSFFNFFIIYNDMDQGINLERFKTSLEMYYFKYGQYPFDLEGFTVPKDEWGREYVYKPKREGYILFSSGPDGREGTKDDIY